MTLLTLLGGGKTPAIPYTPADTQVDVLVAPDNFLVIVPEEETEYADYFNIQTLVDENGNTLVDESGNILITTQASTGNVFVVDVPPDDFSVIVEIE